ncbi:DUF4382 domain-containing protein [Haloplanus sp.]|uniref:DUF4382 domain-containing protein n=1 Tax=Haloplanus sp. TaxID=1961696 RepID=UPI00263198D9|nr:DUF4382 domain-containing protein [Haloplanus sp.]
MRRRGFVATAGGLGTAALAGCSGGGGGGGGGTDTDDGDGGGGDSGTLGAFRLFISDQPAAIGDFDSLSVALSTARVFRADEDETVTPAAMNATTTATPATEAETEADADEDEADETSGVVEFDLDGVTVDLTQVLGDRAVSVLEGELEAGRYSGIELRVETAEGVVDGESVDVMVPSDRLRIVKPFDIATDAELAFVFDINVVRKGPQGGYNLLPVIGKSGVVGEDVDVEAVAPDENDAAADDDSTATPTE